MPTDQGSAGGGDNEEIANLPARPAEDASQVKGGASKTPPAGPVPIPYPNLGSTGSLRSIEPCI